MDWTPHGNPQHPVQQCLRLCVLPEPCYDRLVDLADPEDWGPSNRILKNYLSFSFSRAVFLTERDVDQTAPQLATRSPCLSFTADGFSCSCRCA